MTTARSTARHAGSRRSTVLIVGLLFASSISLSNAVALGKRRHEQPNQRNISIKNKSGVRMDALWINRYANPITYHSNSNDEGTPYGGEQNILSFAGHEFELRELPSKRTGKCKYETCRKALIEVNEQEDQVVVLDRNFIVTHTDRWRDAQNEAKDIVGECRANILKDEAAIISEETIDALSQCVESSLNATLVKKREEHDFQSQLRSQMADAFVPYACSTPNLNMSEEILNQTWSYTFENRNRRKQYQMQVYHERPFSRIFTVEDFVGEDECAALAKANLKPSSDEPGASSISWKDVEASSTLKELMARIYKMGQTAMRWDDLSVKTTTSIPGNDIAWQLDQYVEDVTKPMVECPLYSPHCNLPETKRTMVVDPKELTRVFVFCDKNPKANGGIHFPQAAVHVHPKFGKMVWANMQSESEADEGDAADADSFIVSDGFVQEYHFCPNHTIYTHRIIDPELAASSDE